MNRIIRCNVENEFIRGAGQVIGAAGSHDDVELELSFSPVWEGTAKKIVWFDALNENPVVTVLGTDLLVPGEENLYRVPVPWEAKAVEGEMKLTIRGANTKNGVETRAVVAATACFKVLPAIWDPLAVEGSEPSASVADQLQQEIEDIKGDIVAAAKAADALEETLEAQAGAEAAAAAAQESAGKAAEDRQGTEAAQAAAESAQAGAEAAQTAAESAQAGAEAAEAAAESAKSGAETAKTGAETAREGAQAAQTAAEAGKTGAEAAKAAALSAQAAAQEAAEQARREAGKAETNAQGAESARTDSEKLRDVAAREAVRAKREADRAQEIAGGEFVTPTQLEDRLGDKVRIGPEELVGQMEAGDVVFIDGTVSGEEHMIPVQELLDSWEESY